MLVSVFLFMLQLLVYVRESTQIISAFEYKLRGLEIK